MEPCYFLFLTNWVEFCLPFNVCHAASLLYKTSKGYFHQKVWSQSWKVLIEVWFCELILLNCGNVWNSLDIFQYQILPKELGECRKVQWIRFEIKIVQELKCYKKKDLTFGWALLYMKKSAFLGFFRHEIMHKLLIIRSFGGRLGPDF